MDATIVCRLAGRSREDRVRMLRGAAFSVRVPRYNALTSSRPSLRPGTSLRHHMTAAGSKHWRPLQRLALAVPRVRDRCSGSAAARQHQRFAFGAVRQTSETLVRIFGEARWTSARAATTPLWRASLHPPTLQLIHFQRGRPNRSRGEESLGLGSSRVVVA